MEILNTNIALGYSMRHLTLDDAEAAYNVSKAYFEDTLGEYGGTAEAIRADWGSPGFELDKDSQAIFDQDGKMVAFATLWNTSAPYARAYLFAPVHPDYKDMGFGTALNQWAEIRAKEIGEKAPDHIQLIIICDLIKGDDDTLELLENLGYSHSRNFYTMKIILDKDIPDAQFPDHIRIVTLEEKRDIPAIVRAVSEAFEDHWGFVVRDEADEILHFDHWASKEGDPYFDPSLWFMAMDGDEIAGVSFCTEHAGEHPDAGYVNIVGVRSAWRRQGIAKALLHHSFRVMQERGKPAVALDVDATSLTGANRLYESAGMHVFRQWMGYEKIIRDGVDIRTKSLEV